MRTSFCSGPPGFRTSCHTNRKKLSAERPVAPRTSGASTEILSGRMPFRNPTNKRRFIHHLRIIMQSKLAIGFIALVLLGGASTILTACNTVEGAGKDVSKAGSEVSEEAREHK